MSGTKISAFPTVASVVSTDLIPMVRPGTPNVDYVVAGSQMAGYLANATVPGALAVGNGTAGSNAVNFSQFNPSAVSLGYIHLPGGVTLCWGQAGVNGGNQPLAVTFNYTFSGTPWSAQVSAAAQEVVASFTGLGATGMNVYGQISTTGSYASATIYYLVVGPT